MKRLWSIPLAALFASASPSLAQTGSVPKERPAIRPASALNGWADWERGKKIFDKIDVPPAPVLSPAQELATFRMAPGYRVELVASEPMVANPIFFEFDADGRIWVLEYRGYMRDLLGSDESAPICRMMVLEDTDADGVADKSTVYLDKLAMPRSFAFVEGGVLLAEPPNLWFCQDTNGDLRCDEKKKVGTYGVAGNPQHTANGLRRGIDNWLHNADWGKRHRFRDGNLIVEDTIHRGQFGVSFDDLGRFYTCHESSAAYMDYLPAEYLQRNPALLAHSRHDGGDRDRFGVHVHISRQAQEVFPIRPTPQITLGGLELRDDGTLRTYTVVAGTCVYRGDQFPADARGNLFVPEAGGHLIGRLVPEGELAPQTRRFYPPNQELLASTDERFRPVNARTGPDGALYIADMYKGIIEHVIFMVPWISDQVKARNLETGNDLGRIWRIVSTENPISHKSPALSEATTEKLVQTLDHPNGWRRDTAQRLLVDNRPGEAIPILKKFVSSGGTPLGRMHALWTLDGMSALDWNTATAALHDNHPYVRATALRALEPLVTAERASLFVQLVSALLEGGECDPLVLQQAILSLGSANQADGAFDLLLKLFAKRPDPLGHTATLAALHGREAAFLDHLVETRIDNKQLVDDVAKLVHHATSVDPKRATLLDLSSLTAEQTALAKLGAEKYALLCSACHQPHGFGSPGTAPPLVNSEWVNGPPERLAQIVLRGLVGPVKVRGQEWNLHMPGLGSAGLVDDKEIAAIATYLRRSWGNRADPVDPELVARERKKSAGRKFPWTAPELAGESAPETVAIIEPGDDGRFVLQSKAAQLFAQKLRYHPDLDLIGPWVLEGDAALWQVNVPEPATYEVELTYAMDDRNAGNSYVIESDRSSLTGKVDTTGGFDRFDTVKAGTLSLEKGANRILMRPAGAPKGELIDLRSIHLTPTRP